MAIYFVTRHQGAEAWASRHGLTADVIRHLDVEQVAKGDVVLGTLPVHEVAAINARGARYLHLELDIPETERGRELSAEKMEEFGARLVEYRVVRVGQGRERDRFAKR